MRLAGPIFLLLLSASSTAAAQVTLVVHADGQSRVPVDGVVDERLRERLGGMIRHVDASLDELALAAGCDASSDVEGASCIATIASAAGARLVAIERLRRRGSEWRLDVDVHGADGARVTTIGTRCDPAESCGVRLDGAAQPEAVVAGPTHARTQHPRPEPTTTVAPAPPTTTEHDAPSAPRVAHSISVVPSVLFAGAVLVGVGSFVAGGLALDWYRASIGTDPTRGPSEAARQQSLQDQSTVALGLGLGLAGLGAILAVTGIVTLVGHDGPRLQIGASGITMSVSL